MTITGSPNSRGECAVVNHDADSHAACQRGQAPSSLWIPARTRTPHAGRGLRALVDMTGILAGPTEAAPGVTRRRQCCRILQAWRCRAFLLSSPHCINAPLSTLHPWVVYPPLEHLLEPSSV
ncbi:hypothetical protein AcV5_008289 [Taiwanofungus camphoratus]|nr:hypothetical protein AcV5_008289 [Antrodia cinnamomea]